MGKPHTAIPGSNQADDEGPYPSEHEAHEALIVIVYTARDAEEVVAPRLVNDICDHGNHRNHSAKKNQHKTAAPALLSARDNSRTPGVQHTGETAKDTYQGPRYGDVARSHKLHLNITKAHTTPPRFNIIMRPDEGIDDIEEIEDRKPADEAGGRVVAVFCMQEQRDNTDQERYQRQEWDDHSLRVNSRGCHDRGSGLILRSKCRLIWQTAQSGTKD